jgi:ethanolamine utilization protein EutA (predicted chaperonin)
MSYRQLKVDTQLGTTIYETNFAQAEIANLSYALNNVAADTRQIGAVTRSLNALARFMPNPVEFTNNSLEWKLLFLYHNFKKLNTNGCIRDTGSAAELNAVFLRLEKLLGES